MGSNVGYREPTIYGGGLILLYDSRKFSSCRLLNIPTETFYNISVRLSYGTQQSYNVISIYRKPGYAGLAFREEFYAVLKTMRKRKSILIIGGDMNIRVERLAEPTTAKFLEILAEHDMRQYTCCETQNQEGTIDLCIMKNYTDLEVTVTDVPDTDHLSFPVYTTHTRCLWLPDLFT